MGMQVTELSDLVGPIRWRAFHEIAEKLLVGGGGRSFIYV
jgi:hypothetical protein